MAKLTPSCNVNYICGLCGLRVCSFRRIQKRIFDLKWILRSFVQSFVLRFLIWRILFQKGFAGFEI